MYEETCSDKRKQSAQAQRPLRCRYVDNGVPFCRYARFKMEELNLDPYVTFYYDVIYEKEIQTIISHAEDKIERSRTGPLDISMVSDFRTSKGTWLRYDEHSFLTPIGQRLEDITGLTLKSSEPLQVANYGIGGHYGPHYDFFLVSLPTILYSLLEIIFLLHRCLRPILQETVCSLPCST